MTSAVATDTPRLSGSLRLALFRGIVVLSGVAGLGYQVVWGRMLSVSLGHEIIATLAVIAAFFCGLGLGALLLNRPIKSTQCPQRWYAGLELIIGLWAVLLAVIIPVFNQAVPVLIGLDPDPVWHWSIAFCSSLVLFLPATFAMGATLQAIEKSARLFASHGHPVSGLYALNTLGAAIGVIITAFVIVPNLGHTNTLYLFALANIVCAVATFLLFASAASTQTRVISPTPTTQIFINRTQLLTIMFCCGLLGLGYEVLVIRVLSQILENTVYSFAGVLVIYLLGTVIGAAIYQRTLANSQATTKGWRQVLSWLLIVTCTLCLMGIACLWLSFDVYNYLVQGGAQGFVIGILAELTVATIVFLFPTIAMGALFSHLAQQAVASTGLGAGLSCNTLGAMLAPLIFGVILLPLLGAKTSLVITALGYLLLLPGFNKAVITGLAIPAAVTMAILLVPNPLRFIALPADHRIVEYQEGVMAAVAVVKDRNNDRHLKVNNHFTMGGTASRYSDYRQTHLPLLLHGSAQSALFLGLGTGVTFQAAKYHPHVKSVGVELLPEAVELMHHFDVNPGGGDWPIKPVIYAADARRYILAVEDSYDVIIAEIFHPSRDGAGSLYTSEHFSLIKQRLAPGGLFCQWLPLFQLDLPTLKTIIRTFVDVFPFAELHLGHFSLQQPILCLLGANEEKRFSGDWLLNRVHDSKLQQHLVSLRLNSDFALFGGFLADRKTLQRYAATAPINTDDHPLVTYQAPEFVYSKQLQPARRLADLISDLHREENEMLFNTSMKDQLFSNELNAYWQSRDLFLQTGVGIKPTDDIRKIVSATESALLDAVELSEHFSPAYRSLLGLAQGLYQVDQQAALSLLNKLIEATPQQLPARQLRRQWFGF